MDKIKAITNAIDKANRLESNLLSGTALIPGFTGDKIRHLMNNLGGISKNYLEVGVHRGALFSATVGNSSLENAVAVDNWSEFNDHDPREEFLRHFYALDGIPNMRFIERDCFSIDDKFLGDQKFDLYLYDAGHSYEEQKKALIHFLPYMADEFIFCCDDYSWLDARYGTTDAIAELRLMIGGRYELFPDKPSDAAGWWNGFGVYLLKKP